MRSIERERERGTQRNTAESTPNKGQPARAAPIQIQRHRCQASTRRTRPGCSAPPIASMMSRTRPCMSLITPSRTQRVPRMKTVAPLFPSHSAQTASPAWRSEKSVGGLPCHALRPRGARSPAISPLDQRVLPPHRQAAPRSTLMLLVQQACPSARCGARAKRRICRTHVKSPYADRLGARDEAVRDDVPTTDRGH